MYDIRNCKFEVTVQAWRCLVVLSFMADKRKYMLFLNQARAGRRPARAWFIEITSVRMYVCVSVCLCVHPRGDE